MSSDYYQQVKHCYQQSGGNSIELFQTVQSVAGNIGWNAALACLEQCVIDKRLTWWMSQRVTWATTGDLLQDAYRLFYEDYLGLSIPRDGEVVEATGQRWVTRWWNLCPTLEACQALGLDTREVCRKVYHQPVQVLLSQLDRRLRFKRNYNAIRPYAPYCEEIIVLEEVGE
jgi:hypothetical protein